MVAPPRATPATLWDVGDGFESCGGSKIAELEVSSWENRGKSSIDMEVLMGKPCNDINGFQLLCLTTGV